MVKGKRLMSIGLNKKRGGHFNPPRLIMKKSDQSTVVKGTAGRPSLL